MIFCGVQIMCVDMSVKKYYALNATSMKRDEQSDLFG
jgi:hypothetical protein